MSKEKGKWKNFFTRENMVICTLLGILMLVISIPVGEKNTEKISTASGLSDIQNDIIEKQTESEPLQTELEQRLERFLSCMEGAGEVMVLITFSESEERIVEKDLPASGQMENSVGERLPGTGETVFVTEKDGRKTPYVKKTLAAGVEGVTVLAKGGDSYEIQKQITEMIQALFGIEAHKIRVAKMQ